MQVCITVVGGFFVVLLYLLLDGFLDIRPHRIISGSDFEFDSSHFIARKYKRELSRLRSSLSEPELGAGRCLAIGYKITHLAALVVCIGKFFMLNIESPTILEGTLSRALCAGAQCYAGGFALMVALGVLLAWWKRSSYLRLMQAIACTSPGPPWLACVYHGLGIICSIIWALGLCQA